ncbi:MAG: class I SAM-dependent methyltransferase [Acidobacteriota bacterium]
MKTLAERRAICDRLAERYYPRVSRRDHRLRAVIAERLPDGGMFLDAGCGPYLGIARHFGGQARLSVGMDLVPFYPGLPATGARAVRGDLGALPFLAGSFDVVSLSSVVEHLADPAKDLGALSRLLRRGGWLVALTPSRWYFAAVAGRLIPAAVARRILGFIFGSSVHDNFPVYYRANTPRAMRRVARHAGLELVAAIACPHPPAYLKFSAALFRMGVAFDRLVGILPPSRILQASFLFILRKP